MLVRWPGGSKGTSDGPHNSENCMLFTRASIRFFSVNNRVQKKAVRMLVIVVMLFGFCWLPYHISYLYIDFSQTEQLTQALTSFVLFAQWLMFANSACNPFVYAVLNDNFRREFVAMVSRRSVGRRRRNNNLTIRVETVQSPV